MRRLFARSLVVPLLLTASALAQPKAVAKPKPAATAPKAPAKAAPAASTSAAPAATPEVNAEAAGGEPAAATVAAAPTDAAPPTSAGSEGTKPSPLNPEPREFPTEKPTALPRALDTLLSDIATLRGRVAALTTSLFSSKLRIVVETDGDETRIDGLSVMLDDGVVFRAPAGFVAEDGKVVYEHAVAPGPHVVAIEAERYDPRAKDYRTWQLTKFNVTVPDRRKLAATIVLEDDSGMGQDFPEDQSGEYELAVSLEAEVID